MTMYCADIGRAPPVPLSCEDRVSLWRGRFIEEYSRAEATVSKALAFLAGVASEGHDSLLPYMGGKRIEAMMCVVTGPLEVQGVRIVPLLIELDYMRTLRNVLCHGEGTISTDLTGRWSLVLDMLSFKHRAIETTTTRVTEAGADEHLAQLNSVRIRLNGQLPGLLASFSQR